MYRVLVVVIISIIVTQSDCSRVSDVDDCYKFITNKNESDFNKIQCLTTNKTLTEKEHLKNLNLSDKAIKNDLFTIKEKNRKLKGFERPWYRKVPLIPVLFASSPTLPEGKCKKQAKRYLQELQNGSLWAVRMFDSSTKYPEGIAAGHTRHYGNFDECYQLQTNPSNHRSDPDAIGGRYCLVKVEYQKNDHPSERVGPYTLDFDLNSSVWEAIKEKGDFRRVKRYMLELALCVPDVCSASEIQEALQKPLEELGAKHQVSIKIGIKGCQAQKDEPEFSNLAKIYCYGILSLIFLVVVSTWYDKTREIDEKNNNSLIVDIMMCFSAKRNYKSIIDVTYIHPGLDCIHLLRTISMCMVIIGHRIVQYYANPLVNSEYLERSYTYKSLMLIYNGPIIVEAFFAFGGLLFGYHMLTELDKRKKINFVSAILIRYFRLTPSYLLVIMFLALVLPHLGSGPYWDYQIGFEREACSSNWWTNILYINNYVNTDKLCIFQSWYLTVDYHLYIIALFVVYYFWKMPRNIGYAFLVGIILLSCVIPFYVSYSTDAPLFRGLPYKHKVREDFYFINHYVKTHERLASYFVGVLAGVIIYDSGLKSWKMPKYLSKVPIFLLCIIYGTAVLMMAVKFYNPNINPSPLESALYGSLSRPLFALAIVILIIWVSIDNRLHYKYNGFKPKWAQPLAKLTYGAFLMHGINQSYDVGVARHARTFSTHNIIWEFIADVIVSFVLALVLALLVEGPFRRIEKRFIVGRLAQKTIDKTHKTHENGIKMNGHINNDKKID